MRIAKRVPGDFFKLVDFHRLPASETVEIYEILPGVKRVDWNTTPHAKITRPLAVVVASQRHAIFAEDMRLIAEEYVEEDAWLR